MIEMFSGVSVGQEILIHTAQGQYRGVLLQLAAAVGLCALTLPHGREIRLRVSDVYALEIL